MSKKEITALILVVVVYVGGFTWFNWFITHQQRPSPPENSGTSSTTTEPNTAENSAENSYSSEWAPIETWAGTVASERKVVYLTEFKIGIGREPGGVSACIIGPGYQIDDPDEIRAFPHAPEIYSCGVSPEYRATLTLHLENHDLTVDTGWRAATENYAITVTGDLREIVGKTVAYEFNILCAITDNWIYPQTQTGTLSFTDWTPFDIGWLNAFGIDPALLGIDNVDPNCTYYGVFQYFPE